MKIALIRVGIDKICGGIHSPIFKDGTFEFIPIPEYFYKSHPFDTHLVPTYSTEKGRKGKALIEYFGHGKDKEVHRNIPIHADPEFATFTYGDANATKQSLAKLQKGDFLVFYTLMQGADFESSPGMYVVGYLEVEKAVLVTKPEEYEGLLPDFAHNFHVKNKEIFLRDIQNPKNKGLKLVKGGQGSRLCKYAYLISRSVPIPSKASIHMISDEMLRIFGTFGGKVAIQKEPLRWIRDQDMVARTAKWLRELE